MATKRATYTAEFKLQAVQMVTEQKLSVAEAARRLGVHESRLHEWKKAHLKDGAAAFPGSGHQTPAEAELRQLRADVKRLEMERDILKKATAFLDPGEVTFAWVEERRQEYPVAVMCRVLGVSRSGFYARLERPPTAAAARRADLVARIGEVHAEAKCRYGSPRVHAELTARGVACCVNTVARVMRAAGIRARTSRRFVRTTDSRHGPPVADNVLGRDFAAAGPDEKWCADFTYVPTLEGRLFLAIGVDLFSRRIVGWSMSGTMTSRLVVDALDMAVSRRGPAAGVVAHSDRGSQYASGHYRRALRAGGVTCSMSGVGQCWDNAVVESTFGQLERELVHHESYASRDEARASILEDVEVFYNRVRRHSTLGYISPDEYERTHNPNHRS